MIQVSFTRISHPLPDGLWRGLLCSLPQQVQHDVQRHARWQDRQSRLLGKVLLRQCLSLHGCGEDCLDHLSAGPFGKPAVIGATDFSISHSGELTICAATDRGKIGIDIEKVRHIDLKDFHGCMTPDERERLTASDDVSRAFFTLWTSKECVLKADGRGLTIPMQEVLLLGEEAILQGARWHLRELEIDPSCVCHLATSFRSAPIVLKETTPQELLASASSNTLL